MHNFWSIKTANCSMICVYINKDHGRIYMLSHSSQSQITLYAHYFKALVKSYICTMSTERSQPLTERSKMT